jgi:hypothetical protein
LSISDWENLIKEFRNQEGATIFIPQTQSTDWIQNTHLIDQLLAPPTLRFAVIIQSENPKLRSRTGAGWGREANGTWRKSPRMQELR